MSIRLELLQVARLAPKLLGESTDLVRAFYRRQQNADGGFKDRVGVSDLYYTVFGLDGLIALQEPIDADRTEAYLRKFGGGEGLDLIHLGCLARCWSALPGRQMPAEWHESIAREIERFRAPDGGFNQLTGMERGTVYGSYIAWATYQDLKLPMPNASALVKCVQGLRSKDGGYGNEPGMPLGTTPTTVGASVLLRQCGAPVPAEVGPWLLHQVHPQGGFMAMPMAPIPDLLSTATALHALAGMQVSFEPIKEHCLDFIDTLWTNEGGFHGHWADDVLDVEYTLYGLLALGHLSL
jgi:prenyltransferase beta subunit